MTDAPGARPVPTPPKHPLTQPIPVVAQPARPKRRPSRRKRGRRVPNTPVVFVGPMAAGKTSLGRRVAKELHIPFVDTDAVFVRAHGPIAEFFAAHGEPEFRRIEAEIIREELERDGPRIVALGGGAVVTPETRELLGSYPVVLLMTTQAAVLRTANLEKRPLLRDDPEAWGRILEARRPFYLEVADVTFRTDRASKEQLAQRVMQWIRARGRAEAREAIRSRSPRTEPAVSAAGALASPETPSLPAPTHPKDEPRA